MLLRRLGDAGGGAAASDDCLGDAGGGAASDDWAMREQEMPSCGDGGGMCCGGEGCAVGVGGVGLFFSML